MITLEECAEFAALETSELFTGAILSEKHRSLLSSYAMNLWRGPIAVRKLIVGDIRAAIDLGASRYAADLLLVLRLFLSNHPEARIQRMIGWCPSAYPTRRLDLDFRPATRTFRRELPESHVAKERARKSCGLGGDREAGLHSVSSTFSENERR